MREGRDRQTVRGVVLAMGLCLTAALPVFGQKPRISVSDLEVNSDNPKHKYLGKGIAELVVTQLSKSVDIQIVERDKRSQLLEELEISLSDLSDPDAQLQVGNLLAASHLIFGEIVDMDAQILISLRMIEVDSGTNVWQDSLLAKLGNYEYISGYFAGSILKHLKAGVDASIARKVEAQEEKSEEAVIAFSQAVDLYDRKEKVKARRELERARRADPQNEAVLAYIEKLSPSSPKLRVEIERYAPTYNPASLGLLSHVHYFSWVSMTSPEAIFKTTQITPDCSHPGYPVGDDFYAKEFGGTVRAGVGLPLFGRLSLGCDLIYAFNSYGVTSPFEIPYLGIMSDNFLPTIMSWGTDLSVGILLAPPLSVGAGVGVFLTRDEQSTGSEVQEQEWSADAAFSVGLLVRALGERLLFDASVFFILQEQRYLRVPERDTAVGLLPLTVEGGLTLVLIDKILFFSAKGIGDIFVDARGGFAFRGVPILEYSPLPWLALRAGYEYNQVVQAGQSRIGHGFVVGTTLTIKRWEFNINYTYRKKPLRVLPGYVVPEPFFLIGVSWGGG